MKKCWKNINQLRIRSITSKRKSLIKNTAGEKINENPVDKGKFINTMIKCFNGKVITDFHANKQKEKASKMGSYTSTRNGTSSCA